jgi:molybdate transport system ATP-binding protein
MIELSNVDTIKSGQKIFQDFSWKIKDRENWVISGANGSGKTALLELLAGQTYARKGFLHYDFIEGQTWEEQFQEKRRLIQYIPAHAIQSLVPVKSELYYQQRYYSIGDEFFPLRVRDILANDLHHFQALNIPASFDLDPLLDRDVKQLSNGQLKKVLILQRLLNHLPKLLLLDYPFEGLDRDSRKELCDFIDAVAATYAIQIIIADHGHDIPRCMTHQLTLEDRRIAREVEIDHTAASSSSLPINSPTRPKNGSRTGEAVVSIRDLKIQYGDTVVIENFNWTVNRGDRWAMVGKNGSGKTTVFSLIFADHPLAYSQDVCLFGRRRGSGESIWDIKKRINYLGPELISYLDFPSVTSTAREYIVAQHPTPDLSRLDTLIRFFDAGSFMDKPVRFLSSGQLQLTLLISCFMADKELLLLDEPFQFLSPHQRDRVAEYLQGYLREAITLILITHYDEDLVRWTEKTMRIGRP